MKLTHKKITCLLIIAILCLISYYLNVNISYNKHNIKRSKRPKQRKTNDVYNPWKNVPDFVLYLRLTSNSRWEAEYEDPLVRSMRIFFPIEGLRLLVVLDDEKPPDHSFGERVKNEWPYPEICYRPPGDPDVYHTWEKGRMYWDMLYPDQCTNATFVGFIDTDTLFTTLVTPDLLFENGKPIIVAKVGLPQLPCWAKATELLIGRKEVMQCMSVFPLLIKTSHMKEMREKIAKDHGKSFDSVFSDVGRSVGGLYCVSQFSFMCNYVWYHHRDEYSWHLQMFPNGDWSGEGWVPYMVKPEYFNTKVRPEQKIPIPRVAIHLRYSITNGEHILGREPEPEVVDDFIKEGLCYSGGFKRCPDKCKKWSQNKVHYNIYSFELYQWFWDPRCFAEQQRHYKKVERFLEYYSVNEKRIFGLESIDEMCSLYDKIGS